MNKEITDNLKDKSLKKSEEKRKKIALIASILAIVIAIIGFNTYKSSKIRAARFEDSQEQRQIMYDYWKDQGLTEEEIQSKLESSRKERTLDEDHPGPDLVRLIGGGRGSGTGGGR